MAQEHFDAEKKLTISEAGKLLDVSPETIRAAIRSRTLPSTLIEGKATVRWADLETYRTRARPDGVKRIGRPRRAKIPTGHPKAKKPERDHKHLLEAFCHSDNGSLMLSAVDFRYVVGVMISRFRREIGMTQNDLAYYWGTSSQVIAQMESGRTSVNAGDLPRLALILDVPIGSFFGLNVEAEERAKILEESEEVRRRSKATHETTFENLVWATSLLDLQNDAVLPTDDTIEAM